MITIPICITSNSNQELKQKRYRLIQFLKDNKIMFLITHFEEYQKNNHKHYHSQLHIKIKDYKQVSEYIKKQKNMYESKYMNYEYVIKERKKVSYNSNLQDYNKKTIINTFKLILQNNKNSNICLVVLEYIKILLKIVKLNFCNKIKQKAERMETKEIEKIVKITVNTVFGELKKIGLVISPSLRHKLTNTNSTNTSNRLTKQNTTNLVTKTLKNNQKLAT